jgi:Short C-terminal domain
MSRGQTIPAMSRGRRRTVKALVAVGSVLAFLSVFAIWVERQALNTGDWVHTSDRLIQNPTIRAELANFLVDQLYANVDLEKEFESKLPGETKQFAGPLSGVVRSVAPGGVEKVLETSTAQGLWEDANRSAHEQLLAVLEDKGEAVSTENGEVKLQLGSLVTNLADQIGVGSSLAEKLPSDAAEVTILRSDQLKTAQNIAVALKGLALILSLLTLLALGAAIYLAGDERWVTVLFCGVGLVAAGFAAIVAREVAGGIIVDQLVVNESVKPAAEETWSIATSLMTSIATTVIVVGALFGLAGWLASPTGSARSTRRALAPALWEYPGWVYAGLAVVVAIYFLSAPTQNLRTFVTTLAIAGLAAFGIHELRRQAHEENPEAGYGELFGRTKERMVGAVRSANLGERAAKLRLPEVRRAEGGEEDARLARLERLGDLHAKGVLSDEEFAAEKAKVLGSADESP